MWTSGRSRLSILGILLAVFLLSSGSVKMVPNGEASRVSPLEFLGERVGELLWPAPPRMDVRQLLGPPSGMPLGQPGGW